MIVMQQYLDTDDLYAYTRMLRTADSRLFFLVEGDSDVRALNRQVNESDCELICGYGKTAVIEAMTRLQYSDPDGCVALVDRDFDDWLGVELPTNVFMTELYDREADLLLKCNLLADYIAAVRDEHKEHKFLERFGKASVLEIIVRTAAIVGRVRCASRCDSLNLKLSKFPVHEILDERTIANEEQVAKVALMRTAQAKVTLETVLRACSRIVGTDERQLCNGHDLVSTVVISSRWWARQKLSRRELSNHILATVRCDVLEHLEWFADLKRWAGSRGYRLWNCAA